MNKPLVSVCLACYNHEKYLEECLKSFMCQSYDNIEVLISDDCSKDRSVDVVQSKLEDMKRRFARVIFLKNTENIGAVRTFNQMIEMCEGKYIKLFSGDDMLFPSAIEDLVNYLENHPQCGLVYSNHVTCDDHDIYNVEELKKNLEHKPPVIKGNMTQALYENNFIIAPTVMVRKSVYEQIGLHDDTLDIEDWEFWIRASLSYQIGYLDKATLVYRTAHNSMSRFGADDAGRIRLKRIIQNEFRVLDKYKDHPQISSRTGIRNCCDQGISLAIDLEADEVVADICEYLNKQGIRFGFKMSVKYALYRIGIWKTLVKTGIVKKD